MRNILEKVFQINDFNKQKLIVNETEVIEFSIQNKEYYSIYFADALDSKLPKLVSNLSYKIYESDKLTKEQKSNTTMIICTRIKENNSCNDNNISLTKEEKNIIFNIEEDTTNFKKYVLWYTDKEVKDFKESYIQNIKDINTVSDIVCNSYSKFEKYRQNIDDESGYSLLLRLFIKLPFLTLKNIKSIDKNINDFIKSELNDLNIKLEELLETQQLNEEIFSYVTLSRKQDKDIDKKLLEIELG